MNLVKFHGGAGTVTGSCFEVRHNGVRFLVDCGLFQGSRETREQNYKPFPFDPASIGFVLLTHAHIDHSGLLPKLVRAGFTGPIISTKATRDLSAIMLPDSGHIQEMEVGRKNRKRRRAGQGLLEPIYTVEDAEKSVARFEMVSYGEVIRPDPLVRVRFIDAGHILGSATIEVWLEGEHSAKLVFSGDVGPVNCPIVNDPDGVASADYVVMESTYGNRQRPPGLDPAGVLRDAVQETLTKGGNVVIPAFAVERTQDILYIIHRMQLEGEFPKATIYLDSPMAQAATEVFCQHYEYFDEETREMADRLGKCPLDLPNLVHARTAEESKALNELKGGAIIISASGMCDAGRIKHHLKHNLWRPESTVILAGFQAVGTLGRQLLDGAQEVTIHGETIKVKATIRAIEGFSSHADQGGLLSWLHCLQAKPARVFVVHGEPEASSTLASLIEARLGIEAAVPGYGEGVELDGGRVSRRLPLTLQEMDEQCVLDAERAYLNLGDSLRALMCQAGSKHSVRQRILPLLRELQTAISEEMASS